MRLDVVIYPPDIGAAWVQDTMGGSTINIQINSEIIGAFKWVQEFKDQLQKEVNARASNPALAACYDEYQTMLKLVS